MSSSHQLALALQLESFARFDSFVSADGGTLAALLARLSSTPAAAIVWLHGTSGVGKSHLLQASCRVASEAGLAAMYLSLADRTLGSAQVLEGLENLDLLAVDDLHCVAGQTDWDLALFRVFDDYLSRSGVLLLGSRQPPLGVGFRLPDLESRAAASAVYRLEALDELGQLQALIAHARVRGLILDQASAHYLLHRVRRDMRDVCRWLARLDMEALSAQRRLTIPLIRDVLNRSVGGPE